MDTRTARWLCALGSVIMEWAGVRVQDMSGEVWHAVMCPAVVQCGYLEGTDESDWLSQTTHEYLEAHSAHHLPVLQNEIRLD